MKHTSIILTATMICSVAVSIAMILVYENNILLPGLLAGNTGMEFWTLMLSEIAVICLVPLALWMFRAKSIHGKLVAGREKALLRFGLLRMLMLCIPMMANTLLYYLFMKPSFGYLAIILFLSTLFVYPSMERCVGEVSE